ncbi:nicotinamide riboside transporter PnuC [Hyphococcus flavus]|uniref:Nicotinamide riboside transporter PnuC n=1 Tax=Hyphococcus flavus TaxID=1866326 RepID=A0AAE9ZLJ2_9PROT|nr:nicotinamide riboside transporter PnuC [Hyphococcus flavus]WDI32910.1 nicotinamide riboside transporter PnuC [Hyphococcus flavus]
MSAAFDFLHAMIGERPIEIAAVILGLCNITLLIRRSIWNYPFGIVMVILYMKIFYDAKLYADTVLQIFFVIVQIYGLIHWHNKRDATGLVIVRRITRSQAFAYAIIGAGGVGVIGTAFSRLTDAALPYWDSTILVFSIIAQILLARRRLENWLVWVGVDIVAIGVYWAKGLYPTAGLYAVFLVLATVGYFNWRRAYKSGEAVDS